MQNEISGWKGSTIIAVWSILGTLIGGGIITYGTWRGTEKTNRQQKIEDDKTIRDLKATISSLSQKNEAKTQEVLEFSSKIDNNTIVISKIVESIDEIGKRTNEISNTIKNEQRMRGKLLFPLNKNYYIYNVKLGPIEFNFRENSGVKGSFNGVPLKVQLKDNEVLVSTNIRDVDGSLIFQMENNKWLVDKNRILSLNYDQSGMEVINNDGSIIFQMDIIENRLKFSGWTKDNDKFSIFCEKFNKQIPITLANQQIIQKNFEIYERTVTPLFLHTGEDYLSKRVQSK